jgi:hypothetical protein
MAAWEGGDPPSPERGAISYLPNKITDVLQFKKIMHDLLKCSTTTKFSGIEDWKLEVF